MKRCMTGPSLSTNSVLSIAKARKNRSDFRPSMPAATPLSSVVRISGAAFCTSSVALCALSTPMSPSQPWILSSAWFGFAEMSPDWADMPPKTRQKMRTPIGNKPEQDENRAPDARDPVPFEPADRGSGDRAEHRGEDDRHDDRRSLGEQPDEPEDDQDEADQQPRREAQIPEPRGRCKLNVGFGRHRSALFPRHGYGDQVSGAARLAPTRIAPVGCTCRMCSPPTLLPIRRSCGVGGHWKLSARSQHRVRMKPLVRFRAGRPLSCLSPSCWRSDRMPF